MPLLTGFLIVVLLLTNIALLGLRSLRVFIRLVALQGILLGAVTVLINLNNFNFHVLVLAAVNVGMKGFVFPMLLYWAIRDVGVRLENEPLLGFGTSLLFGIVMMGVACWLGERMPLFTGESLPILMSGALMTIFTGLFLIVARQKALTQALGYLVFESGIYALAISVVGHIPVLVEVGLLLDAFVAVYVMGIAILNINREFDHMDVDQFNTLKG
jgi:hydrogenase-4 component E